MTRLCEHCGVNVEVDASNKFVHHDPASNKDAQKRADGACLGSGRKRYWEELPPTCPTCCGPIPTTVEVEAHEHAEECEGCGDFCWYGIGGDHCSSELPDGMVVNCVEFTVALNQVQYVTASISEDDLALAAIRDEPEHCIGRVGCDNGALAFRVDNVSYREAAVVARRVRRRLLAFLTGRHAERVRELREGGMDDDHVARQIVDDGWRAGLDLRFQQHLIEQAVKAVPKRGS